MSTIAGLIALALLAWLAVPADDAPLSTSSLGTSGTSGTSQPGDPALGALPSAPPTKGQTIGGGPGSTSTAAVGSTSGTGGTGQSGGGGSTTGTTRTTSGTSSGGSVTKRCPTGTSDQGITSHEAKIAITIINIVGAAGNGTVGVPSPQVQEKQWTAVVNSLNAAGGAGCRKLVPTFYSVNPIDPSDAQAKCLQMASAKPFLAIDSGALTEGLVSGAGDCLPQQSIPLLANTVSADQIKAYYPYFLVGHGLASQSIRNGVLAFKKYGYFGSGKGFKKLGIVYRTCLPALYQATRASLKEAGVPDSAIIAYNFGCPAGGQNTPADYQQAALTFKREGVTHVTEANMNIVVFTKSAAQQNFKPQYLVADDAIVGTNGGSDQPDYANYDGAFVVNASRYGEETTPRYKPSSETAKCNAVMRANGFAPVYQQPAGYGGIVCSLLSIAKALLDHMPQAARASLIQGMHSIGKLDPSYPGQPTDFSLAQAASGHGTSFWRVGRYHASCRCYQMSEAAFHPPFP